MGSYHGAEICELVRIYILSRLSTIIDKNDSGLYRDDGLLVLRNVNGQQIDRVRKNTIQTFKNVAFLIDIETNLKIVDFLHITFELINSTFKPYKKPNDSLLYIKKSSNHPPQIIKQLPQIINDRLLKNSSNEEVFNKSKGKYENALKHSGYNHISLKYQPLIASNLKHKRKRNTIWFNPPFSCNVSTNVAKKFLQLLDKHFPPSNSLHRIFNRNTVKVSYCCTKNLGNIIKSHNKKLISFNNQIILPCNYRKKEECPVEGKCRVNDVIYKCIVSAAGFPNKFYLGTAEGEFKKRF